MFTIIQDYKNYKTLKKIRKSASRELKNKFNQLLWIEHRWHVFLNDCSHNVYFSQVIQRLKVEKPHLLEEYVKDFAPFYHASSCFFVFRRNNSFRPRAYKEEEVRKCVHNHENGVLSEHNCSQCSKYQYENLVEYYSLKNRVQSLQRAEKEAKQNLLDNFSFLKQK